MIYDLLLLAITVLWGATFVVVKDALANADPLTFLGLRFTLGAGFAVLWAGSRLRDWPSVKSGVILGLLLFIGYWAQTAGLALIAPGRSAFITGLCVAFVPFCSWFALRRIPSRAAAVGIVVAIAGLYVFTGGVNLTQPVGVGDALTVVCALAFSVHIALTEKFALSRDGRVIVAIQLAVTALACGIAWPLQAHHLAWSWPFLLAIILCGVVANALAINVQTFAQRKTPAVRAALIFSLEPIFASGLSFALGREHWTWSDAVGAGLIFSAVIVAELGPKRPLWSRV